MCQTLQTLMRQALPLLKCSPCPSRRHCPGLSQSGAEPLLLMSWAAALAAADLQKGAALRHLMPARESCKVKTGCCSSLQSTVQVE